MHYQEISRATAEAATSIPVVASASGTTMVGVGQWLQSGPGIATVIGLCITIATFVVQVWSIIRRDRREQRLLELQVKEKP